MARISLKEFIDKTKGTKVDVPWGNGNLKGQCVSLVQQYIHQCLGQPMKPRGNAKDWKKTYVNEGLGKITKSPKYGDIIVYNIGTYGHIAIYINSTTMYDQNNGYHDNYRAGYGSLIKGGTYLRPNVSLIPDKDTYTKGVYRLLYDKALRKNHNLGNNIYKISECNASIKKYTTTQKANSEAKLKKGTDVNIVDVYNETGRIWGKLNFTKPYWVVLRNKDGKAQAKRIG